MSAKRLEEDFDTIDSWENFVKYCGKFSPDLIVDSSDSSCVRIFKMSGMPPEVEFSILVKNSFHVDAYRGKSKIPIRDLVNGFSISLQKYSQLDSIIERLKNTPLDLSSELRFIGEKMLSLSDEFVDEDAEDGLTGDRSKRRKLSFLGKQVCYVMFSLFYIDVHESLTSTWA